MPTTDRTPTIRDVAKSAGVSTATVSRVLNGVPSVDQRLTQKVLAAAEKLSYTPNLSGRDFRKQATRGWSVIVPDIQNPFFTGLVAALEAEALKSGLHVMLCNSNECLDRERTYINAAVSGRVGGVVIAVVSAKQSSVRALERAGIPVVLVDRRLSGFTGVMIGCDNVAAGRQVAEHLAAEGVRRPLCLVGPADVPSTEDRLRGFWGEMARCGIFARDDQILRFPLTGAEVVDELTERFQQDNCPDAIFATNGPLTASAFRALRAAGRSLPDEVRLVGVDDDQWTELVDPPVSVISQPVTEMGSLAGRVLSGEIPLAGEQKTLLLDPELIVRGSSA